MRKWRQDMGRQRAFNAKLKNNTTLKKNNTKLRNNTKLKKNYNAK